MKVEAEHLHEDWQRELAALLSDDQVASSAVADRLAELEERVGERVYPYALRRLARVPVDSKAARAWWEKLYLHRGELQQKLGRDPGFRVAAVDLILQTESSLQNPVLVESDELDRIRRSALTDDLTGLYNRRFFLQGLDNEIRRSRRYDVPMALLSLDLDAFKPINDLYGHPFGDRVLVVTGALLQREVREADLACRVGGEEFAVILPETDRLGAYIVAERIRTRLKRHFAKTRITEGAQADNVGRVIALTVSGGIACFPGDAQDADSLMRASDQALYKAKRHGRDNIMNFHAEQRSSVRYPFHEASKVLVRRKGAEQELTTAPVDLSLGGALIEVEGSLDDTERVELWLATESLLRKHESSDEPAWVSGRVVRVEPGLDAARRRIAIAFDKKLSEGQLATHAARAKPIQKERSRNSDAVDPNTDVQEGAG